MLLWKKDATTKPKLAFELIWACHRCFHSLPSQSWHFLMHFKVNERLIIYHYGAFKRIISTQKFLPIIFDKLIELYNSNIIDLNEFLTELVFICMEDYMENTIAFLLIYFRTNKKVNSFSQILHLSSF